MCNRNSEYTRISQSCQQLFSGHRLFPNPIRKTAALKGTDLLS